ncbi:MAG: hypothetical protein LC808_27990, partial [Actinobacteria bacterium]|nr:hypothetical protein [Actinomycetota bacterium]
VYGLSDALNSLHRVRSNPEHLARAVTEVEPRDGPVVDVTDLLCVNLFDPDRRGIARGIGDPVPRSPHVVSAPSRMAN